MVERPSKRARRRTAGATAAAGLGARLRTSHSSRERRHLDFREGSSPSRPSPPAILRPMGSSADIARLVASLIDANLPALDERPARPQFRDADPRSHMPAPPGGSQPMEVARRRLVREGRAADALALSSNCGGCRGPTTGCAGGPLLRLLGAELSPPPGPGARRGAVAARARARAAARLAPAPERVRAPSRSRRPRGLAYGAPPPVPPPPRRARRRRRGGRGGAGARGALRDAEHRRRPPRGPRETPSSSRRRCPWRRRRGSSSEDSPSSDGCAPARATRHASRRAAPTPTLRPPTRAGIGSSTRMCTLRRQVRRRASCPRRCAGLDELREWFQLIAVLEAQHQSELALVQLLVACRADAELAMVKLVRAADTGGGAMCVAMRTYERHGDPALSKPSARRAPPRRPPPPPPPARPTSPHANTNPTRRHRSSAWFNERATRD